MKASELRLGNWVKIGDTNCIVKSIDLSGVTFCIGIKLHSRMNYIKPIPLTEQWLKDFGFIDGGKDDFISPCYSYRIYEDYRYKGITGVKHYYWNFHHNNMDCKTIAELKYVHQLQNLYFALTGEELIKK
jgi:hypothetical protein